MQCAAHVSEASSLLQIISLSNKKIRSQATCLYFLHVFFLFQQDYAKTDHPATETVFKYIMHKVYNFPIQKPVNIRGQDAPTGQMSYIQFLLQELLIL